jgi:hypothetical protein
VIARDSEGNREGKLPRMQKINQHSAYITFSYFRWQSNIQRKMVHNQKAGGKERKPVGGKPMAGPPESDGEKSEDDEVADARSCEEASAAPPSASAE